MILVNIVRQCWQRLKKGDMNTLCKIPFKPIYACIFFMNGNHMNEIQPIGPMYERPGSPEVLLWPEESPAFLKINCGFLFYVLRSLSSTC